MSYCICRHTLSLKCIARTHGLCACRWINNDPWSSKADQATSSHCRTKSHSTKIRRSRPVFWQPVQCQWECNVRRLKPNFSINAGSIKATNYSHNIPHDSERIVTIYWLLAVMLAFISFTINSRKTAWVLRTARILSADHLVYSIRNTTLNEWNLHETSVIPTSGTEIRYLNLTRPQAEWDSGFEFQFHESVLQRFRANSTSLALYFWLIPQPLPHLCHIFLLWKR